MIKELQEEDFEKFYFLKAEVEYGKQFRPEDPRHVEWLRHKVSSVFYSGIKAFGYFIDKDTPVGYLLLKIDDMPAELDSQGRKAYLTGTAVFEKYRRRGFGSELLNYAEAYSISRGISCIYTTVLARSYKAVSFYKKFGFEPIAFVPGVNSPDDAGVIYMRKLLT